MIDQVFEVLSTKLNTHVQTEEAVSEVSIVAGGKHGGDQASLEKIVFTLVHVGQDQTPVGMKGLRQDHDFTKPQALIRLNLHVLVKSNFSDYSVSLKMLSEVIRFFHDWPVIDAQNTPALPRGIERLAVELENMDLESASNLWTMQGESYVPSVLYKVRVIVGDEDQLGRPVPGGRE